MRKNNASQIYKTQMVPNGVGDVEVILSEGNHVQFQENEEMETAAGGSQIEVAPQKSNLEKNQILLLKESEDDMTNHNDQATYNHNSKNFNGKIAHQTNGTGTVILRKRVPIHAKNGKPAIANGANNGLNEYFTDEDGTEAVNIDELKRMKYNEDKYRNCLLKLEDMPVHLQFNKYVHNGYREVQNVYGCFKSLFYFHNETVNIITHVVPIIFIILYYTHMWPWEATEHNIYFTLLGWSHILGSIFPWLGSVGYHLFMNHHLGARLYQILLQVDMFGIWMAQCVGAMTNLTASTWCLPEMVQTTWMALYGIASFWGLYKALTAWSPLARRLCFSGVLISRVVGFLIRISSWGGGEPEILLHVILQDLVSVIGGLIGVIRVPEKWFPGKLDMFCNSHHIMHVLVVWAVFHMNQASNGDIRWILKNYSSRSQCTPLF